MGKSAKRSDPKLWERVKRAVTRGGKGGEPGQWSARKAQLAVQDYKKKGGGYAGAKKSDNSLSEWTREDWGTKSGRRSKDSGERYLPREAREALSDKEYRRTSDKKRTDTGKGRQYSAQPNDIARKTAPAHAGLDTLTRDELLKRAKAQGLTGVSRLRKAALLARLRG